LPESWSRAESDIERQIRARIARGTVNFSLRMRLSDDVAAYRVNVAALNSYIEQIRPMQAEANPSLRIDIGNLLQLPGVCEPPDIEDICQRTYGGVMHLITQCLDQVIEMRKKEGQLLKADLLEQCGLVERNLVGIAARNPIVVQEYHQKLAQRVADLTKSGKIDLDQENLAREVAIYADRCDIAEEVARLTGHIVHFRQAIVSPEPGGRKLDFIAQEMLREANTIGSKSNDVEIAHAVVEVKTAIDRIKEQVQNAE
jgi:uncharacterized protein (TIGR00255 family)